jgi:hypothetical protein
MVSCVVEIDRARQRIGEVDDLVHEEKGQNESAKHYTEVLEMTTAG